MKRALVAATALAIASLATPAPVAAGPAPDLVISSFGLTSWGTCAPGKTVFTFQVTVKNQSTVAMPEREIVVLVKDLKSSPSEEWATGVGLQQPLAPGKTITFTVPMAYYTANPGYMTSGAPHPFQATVNPNHTVMESNYNNDAGPGPAVYQGKRVIEVGAPKGCPKSK